MQCKNEFTGFTIKPEVDLSELRRYGFYKTTPVDINPWWQRPFNMDWHGGVFGTWDSELSVNRNDRKLLLSVKDKCTHTKWNAVILLMITDGILEGEESI